LEAVKMAKNVAKPVQQALVEAVEAFNNAKAARSEHLEVHWATKLAKEQRVTVMQSTSTAQAHSPKTGLDPALAEIAREIKELRREVGEIRSVLDHGAEAQAANEGKWSEVVRRKPSVTKGIQRPTAKAK